MIKIVANDNCRFEADKYEDLVIMMKLDMWIPPKTKELYMAGVAERTEVFQGKKIVYHDSKTFLVELLRLGVLVKIIDNGCEIKALSNKGGSK